MARRGSRYLGILRGTDNEAATKTIAYLRGTRKVTYEGRRGNRPALRRVKVRLFDMPIADTKFLLENVNQSRWATVKPFVNTFTFEVESGDSPDDLLDIPLLNAPRALIVLDRSDIGTRKVSEISGLEYKSYGGTSVSVPFGKSTASGSNVNTAFSAIRTAVKNADVRNMCSLVPGTYVG
ncbi:MAG: hypothetical protein KME35_08075 [Aphanocapsa sp. GSE-SYN-MK-11-07L]|jgi:hypothetical protein|nr:hypothetical protein [Aphanocapsa sp. GSE-SYN-MK-11-07L]